MEAIPRNWDMAELQTGVEFWRDTVRALAQDQKQRTPDRRRQRSRRQTSFVHWAREAFRVFSSKPRLCVAAYAPGGPRGAHSLQARVTGRFLSLATVPRVTELSSLVSRAPTRLS